MNKYFLFLNIQPNKKGNVLRAVYVMTSVLMIIWTILAKFEVTKYNNSNTSSTLNKALLRISLGGAPKVPIIFLLLCFIFLLLAGHYITRFLYFKSFYETNYFLIREDNTKWIKLDKDIYKKIESFLEINNLKGKISKEELLVNGLLKDKNFE